MSRGGPAGTEARVIAIVALLLVLAWSSRIGSASAQTVTRVAAGRSHTLFVESDGTLWGMGDNEYGQLGLGYAPAFTNVPQQITSGTIGMVAVRENHSLFTIGNGLWAMGENAYGELGDGTYVNHVFPENVVSIPGASTFTGLARGIITACTPSPKGCSS